MISGQSTQQRPEPLRALGPWFKTGAERDEFHLHVRRKRRALRRANVFPGQIREAGALHPADQFRQAIRIVRQAEISFLLEPSGRQGGILVADHRFKQFLDPGATPIRADLQFDGSRKRFQIAGGAMEQVN